MGNNLPEADLSPGGQHNRRDVFLVDESEGITKICRAAACD
jgi:hypothetical protein